MIWLPRTTDNSTHFAQSLEIRGIESRLYMIVAFSVCNHMYTEGFLSLGAVEAHSDELGVYSESSL